MSQDNYILKDIPGYEGRYAVTTDGRVWSYPKSWYFGAHEVNGYHNGKWLKIALITGDYLRVVLTKDKKVRTHNIHRLVALTHIPNPDNLPVVNHKNGNKHDNRVENLEWCTMSYNHNHAFATGLYVPQRGEMRPNHKLTESLVKEIRILYEAGHITQDALAKQYGVSPGYISHIILRNKWKHVA